MIKNLIFDFGKVLVDYDYFFIIDRIFSTHARALDFYTRLMGDKWTERFDREDIPFDSIIGQLQQAMPQYAAEIAQFALHYNDFVLGEVAGMRRLLTEKKAEGYKLYGLSNWCSKVYHTMAKYPIFSLLDGRVISSEDKIIKPEPEIYALLCDRYSLRPDESVFTDDVEANVEAARRFGLHAIQFKNAEQYESDLRAILSREGSLPRP